MNNTQLHNQAIALAGLFQAVKLVRQVAGGEHRDDAALQACLTGVLETDPETAARVFGDLHGLRTGLETLIAQLGSGSAGRNVDITRHVVTVLHLERKLSRNRDMLDQIGACIRRARDQVSFFGLTHTSVMASLADCYRQTVSTLQPRVMINGDPVILENPDNQNLIRALLLAAIRAAVLWRQCGGGRLALVLRRKALVEAAGRLLETAGGTD
jgi:high frequency lysogenization protein